MALGPLRSKAVIHCLNLDSGWSAQAYDQRTQVCYGSLGEVRRFEEYM